MAISHVNTILIQLHILEWNIIGSSLISNTEAKGIVVG